jgi:hypothetical protein
VSDPVTLAPHAISIQQACDRQALQHLAVAYSHAIDRRDYELLRSLYHDDAIDDHRPFYTGSADGYVAWLPSMMASWAATSHRIVSMLFLIDGEDAEGELAATAWHRTLDGTRDFVAHGRYVDRYSKRAGVWRFAHRAFILDWSEEHTVAAADDFGTDGVATGRSGGDDPVYSLLPMFGADRSRRR